MGGPGSFSWLEARAVRMPDVHRSNMRSHFVGEKMKTLRWILGIVLVGAVVGLVIVFWPTIMQTGRRIVGRAGARDSDELDEFPKAA